MSWVLLFSIFSRLHASPWGPARPLIVQQRGQSTVRGSTPLYPCPPVHFCTSRSPLPLYSPALSLILAFPAFRAVSWAPPPMLVVPQLAERGRLAAGSLQGGHEAFFRGQYTQVCLLTCSSMFAPCACLHHPCRHHHHPPPYQHNHIHHIFIVALCHSITASSSLSNITTVIVPAIP